MNVIGLKVLPIYYFQVWRTVRDHRCTTGVCWVESKRFEGFGREIRI